MSPSTSSSETPFAHTANELALERLVMAHVALLLIFATWAFGGNVDWARTTIAYWGTLSLPLLILLVRDNTARRSTLPKTLLGLWPLLGFNTLVIISLFFAGFRPGYYGGELLFISNDVSAYLPSSARPDVSLRALWIFDGIYLSCFNLLFAIKTRHAFRLLLFAFSINAICLAVFGTLQKLSRADGLYFGLQSSPQPKFFSTFIYHNHWGAFTILMIALGIGIFFHYLRRKEGQEFLRSPGILVATSVVLLAISLPLSGSRSSSLMALALLVLAFSHWVLISFKRRRRRRQSPLAPIVAAAVIFTTITAAAYHIGKPVIHHRLSETKGQIADITDFSNFGSRPILYRDTWSMTKDRLIFGWGMGSYPTVFPLYNTSDTSPIDGLPKYFHDAHSDWLQSISEVGLSGTALLVLCALIPLWQSRHALFNSPISNYLLIGNVLIILYAGLEFPFGNIAVLIAFWICYFSALRYGRISPSGSR